MQGWVTVLGLGAILGLTPACGEDRPARPDAGGSGDAGGETCGAPDRSCPAVMPSPGGLCEGVLDCVYVEPSTNQWRYSCPAGVWVAENVLCAHDGICVPPLFETCEAPFAGTLAGATVEVGPPAGAFRAFAMGDAVPIVWGPQGGAMIPARIRVAGADAPDCIREAATVTVDALPGAPQRNDIALHCGLSQPVFLILPVSCGVAPEYVVDLDVMVDGIGATQASLRATGGVGVCPLGF